MPNFLTVGSRVINLDHVALATRDAKGGVVVRMVYHVRPLGSDPKLATKPAPDDLQFEGDQAAQVWAALSGATPSRPGGTPR